jgi:hypothetical protein
LSDPGAQQLCAPIEADLDSVRLASDFGKELFAYVVQAMNASPGGPR